MQHIPQGDTNKGLLRLPQVLALIPISRSAWWAGCKDGIYPKPIKLSARTTVWKASEIYALIDRLTAEVEQK